MWIVNTITRSYATARESTHAIHVLLNKLITATARAIYMRPGSSREVKPKKLLATSRSLRAYHHWNHLTGKYDYEKLVWCVSKHATILLGTNKAKDKIIRRTNTANNEGETEIVRRGEYTVPG
jgi:hypothetical protein